MATVAKVVPPFRFATVEVGVYRGAYPTLKNFPFLEARRLRTVISLIPEKPTQDLEDFCEINNVDLVHHVVEKKKDDVPVSSKDISEIIALLIRADRLPVYLHCLDGADVTGVVIACLRRLQGWHKECISNEFSRYSRSGEMSSAELKLVNSVRDIEIGESYSLPGWLWQGKLPQRHPFVKLLQGGKGGVVHVSNPRREEDKQPKLTQDRWSAGETSKDRRRAERQTSSPTGLWKDAQMQTARREDPRRADSWFMNSSGISETEEDFTSCGEELVPVENRLLDALALCEFSDFTPQYRPSL